MYSPQRNVGGLSRWKSCAELVPCSSRWARECLKGRGKLCSGVHDALRCRSEVQLVFLPRLRFLSVLLSLLILSFWCCNLSLFGSLGISFLRYLVPSAIQSFSISVLLLHLFTYHFFLHPLLSYFRLHSHALH